MPGSRNFRLVRDLGSRTMEFLQPGRLAMQQDRQVRQRRGGGQDTVQDGVEVIGNFHIIHHVLIDHKLSYLRDPNTHIKEFNRLLKEIAMLMTYEITKDFPSEEIEIDAEFGRARGRVISGKKAVLVPIMRAGLVMCQGIMEVTASSRMGHIGLYRDRERKEVIEYLVQLPPSEGRTFILTDPMLATGTSACKAIEILQENGTDENHIRFVCLIVSRSAIEHVSREHPEVRVYAAAIDPDLTDDQRIKPGLGYIGQRLFGTF